MTNRLNIKGEHYIPQIVRVALAQLYYLDPMAHKEEKLSAYLRNKPTPDDTPLQQQLHARFPKSRRVHLYFAESGLIPTHYLVLHKSDKAFVPKCDRICTTPNPPTHEGIIIKWSTPVPHLAVSITPTLHRIFTSTNTLADEIEYIPELKRELGLCTEVFRLFSKAPTLAIWTTPGRCTFTVDTSELVSSRPYAKNVSKPRVIIWANCPHEEDSLAADLPRHIIPQVRDAVPLIASQEHRDRDIILSELLLSRTLPYIALQSPNRDKMIIYGLSYDPATHTSCVAAYAERRALPSNIPTVFVDPIIPNYAFVARVAEAIFERPTENAYWNRIDSLRHVFKALGYSPDRWHIAFEAWGYPLSANDRTRLTSIEGGITH